MFIRKLQSSITKWLFKGQVIIIYGARQVGKTTLARTIAKEYVEKNGLDPSSVLYFDCDLIENQDLFSSQSKVLFENIIANKKIIIIDEAQRVPNIGINLKILHTHFPNLQIIATGSSSFDLANKINEPLTGRNIQFDLYPLSIGEIGQKYNILEIGSLFNEIFRFGLYPAIFGESSDIAQQKLTNLSSNYLYKDLLMLEDIQKSNVLIKMLQHIAVHIGSEFSYTELGQELGINKATAEKYLDLLEKCFVIYKLKPLKRSITKEITHPFKVYFWDLGIRNSLIAQFNNLDVRGDIGGLWENFCITERIKQNRYNNLNKNYYFWRTSGGKEFDFVEESGGKFEVFEFKWSETKAAKVHQEFFDTYPNSTLATINRKNWYEFINIGGWKVQSTDTTKPSMILPTKLQAVVKGTQVAKNNGSEYS
jgi:uncharacterized protein